MPNKDVQLEENIQLEPCHCSECDMIRKEFLINKLKEDETIPNSGVFWFDGKGNIIWKSSCPSCGGDMDFSFGDFIMDYAMGKREIEYQAFCLNKECNGHIDDCGWVL